MQGAVQEIALDIVRARRLAACRRWSTPRWSATPTAHTTAIHVTVFDATQRREYERELVAPDRARAPALARRRRAARDRATSQGRIDSLLRELVPSFADRATFEDQRRRRTSPDAERELVLPLAVPGRVLGYLRLLARAGPAGVRAGGAASSRATSRSAPPSPSRTRASTSTSGTSRRPCRRACSPAQPPRDPRLRGGGVVPPGRRRAARGRRLARRLPRSRPDGSGSWSATWWAAGCRPRPRWASCAAPSGALALAGPRPRHPARARRRVRGRRRRDAHGDASIHVDLDVERGRATIASAGHPPALLLVPGAPPRLVWEGRSPPLGVFAGAYAAGRDRGGACRPARASCSTPTASSSGAASSWTRASYRLARAAATARGGAAPGDGRRPDGSPDGGRGGRGRHLPARRRDRRAPPRAGVDDRSVRPRAPRVVSTALRNRADGVLRPGSRARARLPSLPRPRTLRRSRHATVAGHRCQRSRTPAATRRQP